MLSEAKIIYFKCDTQALRIYRGVLIKMGSLNEPLSFNLWNIFFLPTQSDPELISFSIYNICMWLATKQYLRCNWAAKGLFILFMKNVRFSPIGFWVLRIKTAPKAAWADGFAMSKYTVVLGEDVMKRQGEQSSDKRISQMEFLICSLEQFEMAFWLRKPLSSQWITLICRQQNGPPHFYWSNDSNQWKIIPFSGVPFTLRAFLICSHPLCVG